MRSKIQSLSSISMSKISLIETSLTCETVDKNLLNKENEDFHKPMLKVILTKVYDLSII